MLKISRWANYLATQVLIFSLSLLHISSFLHSILSALLVPSLRVPLFGLYPIFSPFPGTADSFSSPFILRHDPLRHSYS